MTSGIGLAQHDVATTSISSTLLKLLMDEMEKPRLAAEQWLRKWLAGEREAYPAWTEALSDALPAFCRFRMAMRNFAEGHALEIGLPGGATNGEARADAMLREDLLRCYIFVLCRQTARKPGWQEAYKRFLNDDVALIKLAPNEPTARATRIASDRQLVVEVASTMHAWITTNYSDLGVPTKWPVVSELGFSFLVTRPGNIKLRSARFEGDVTEYLLPTLSALKRVAIETSGRRLRQLRDQHLEAGRKGREFQSLIGETSRLSDARRQVFLRLYAMAIERIAWLSDEISPSPQGGSKGGESPNALAEIGRRMDQAMETPSAHLLPETDNRLADWASGDLLRAARRALPGKAAPYHRRMEEAVAGIEAVGVGEAASLSARVEAGSKGKRGVLLALRVAEHEMPASVRWYEIELASLTTNAHGSSEVLRIPATAPDPTMETGDGEEWARYEFFVADRHRPLLPRILSDISCGAAFRTTKDGVGAYVLALVG